MDGDMGCIGHQAAAAIEEGTGEIQSLFDVHRASGLAQPLAHPLGDGAEAVLEQFQLYRIHARRPGVRCLHLSGCWLGGGVRGEGSIPLQQQFAGGQHLGAPAQGQKDGASGLNDQGRPHPQALAIEMDQRAATGGHRMDGDHGCQQGKAGQLGPLAPLGDEHFARAAGGDVKDIGGGAAHVKAHQRLSAQSSGARRPQGPHQPPGGPGKNRVLGQQLGGINQTAVGLHHPHGT